MNACGRRPAERLLALPGPLLDVNFFICQCFGNKTLTWNGTYFQTQVTEIFLTHIFFLLMSSRYQRISQTSCWGQSYSSGGPYGSQNVPPKVKNTYANFNMTKNAAPKLNLDSDMMDHLFLMG